MVALASDPARADPASLRFRDPIALGLGPRLLVRMPAADVRRRAAWRLPADGAWGRVGRLSALDVLTAHLGGDGSWRAPRQRLRVSVGDHPRCAAPPGTAPPGLGDLRRISVQPRPRTIASCLDWFGVDLFVDTRHRVVAVTLDLWEP